MRRSTYILRAVTRSSKREAPVTRSVSGLHRCQLEAPGVGGECLLFLASAHNVPPTCSNPSISAWAETPEGTVIGRRAQWTAKPGNLEPAWSVSQPLGFVIIEHLDAKICLELRDQNKFVGSLEVFLKDLLGKGLVTHDFKCSTIGQTQCNVVFQVVDAQSVLHRRTVYFIRHAESVWNHAQSNNNFYEMLKAKDHPLSKLGRDQAEALSKRIRSAGEAETETKACPILHPEAIYVSPLTRAVQTAVIALQPIFELGRKSCDIIFMASAREKQNFGGLDTKSSTVGADVVQRALNETRILYEGSENKSIVESFRSLRFDIEEVQEQWWHSKAKESHTQLEGRLNEFLSQLLYSPHKSVIVVGHSHFFRAVFQRYLSSAFCERQPRFAERLKTWKLMNCGVARVELDPSLIPDYPIADVELILGTDMLPPKRGPIKRCCFCCYRRVDTSGDRRPDEQLDRE